MPADRAYTDNVMLSDCFVNHFSKNNTKSIDLLKRSQILTFI